MTQPYANGAGPRTDLLLVDRGVGVQPGFGEHRRVMALSLDRALSADEQVHHINGLKTDNRLENEELWSTSCPSGRRIGDLLEFCMATLDRYGEQFWPVKREQGNGLRGRGLRGRRLRGQ